MFYLKFRRLIIERNKNIIFCFRLYGMNLDYGLKRSQNFNLILNNKTPQTSTIISNTRRISQSSIFCIKSNNPNEKTNGIENQNNIRKS